MLAVASIPFSGPERKILKITETAVSTLSDSGITQPLDGVWFSLGKKYYVAGSGIYRKDSLLDDRWVGTPLELTQFYSNAIRGADTNNVFIVGAFGDVLHYNGSSWKSYPELLMSDASLYSVAVRGNDMVAVGFLGEKAVVIRGKSH